jgi:hypothetical protein
MELGADARQLLGVLDVGGKAANPASLRGKVGWTEHRFVTACEELCATGTAEWKGRRLARLVGDGISPTKVAVSREATMLLEALPDDGSTVGGLRIRSSLDLDDETFTRAKRELQAAQLVMLGRGRGGTIARAAAPAERRPSAGLVAKESDLYEPFLHWVQAGFADQPGFAHVKKTASPAGWRSGGGKWSRPDVTAIQVIAYEWLPQVTVEISSYEIKKFADAQKLESVYEAAAHGRWAHRVSLVVELDRSSSALPDALLGEIQRFHLGLYVMRAREDGGFGFDIREEIAPPLNGAAELENVNDLIDTFLGRDANLRAEYRRFIS